MELDAARDFLRTNHRAVLHTPRSSGDPQLSPIVVGVDDEGCAIISTREPSMKVANLRRDPRASLCAFTDDFFGPWVRVDGRVEIVPLPDAMDGLIELFRQVAGEHDDWEEFRQAMTDERRVLLRVHLEAAGPDRSG
jgi:PPOX class probable F420-dependent enzyme